MLLKKLNDIIAGLRNQPWVEELLVSGNIYLVGGCLRDAYRNEDIKDIDIIVEKLSIDQIKHLLIFYGRVDVVGESFAVIKFKPNGYEGEPYDIAVPRSDIKTGNGHKGFTINTENVSIYKDLERRDFTINSIAINIETDELIDPYNGIQDIQNHILRATNPNAFIEDPLRILRGISFSSRFDYKIDPATIRLMKENSYLIQNISGERIFEEFMKLLNKGGNTQIAFDLLSETNIDVALFGKKMLKYDRGLENLDHTSFFYVLGILGDVDPEKFILNRLRGYKTLAKEVKTLDKLLTILPHIEHDEEELKLMVSKSLVEGPSVAESLLLPDSINQIIFDMCSKKIPFSIKNVQVNGDDILLFSQETIQGKAVGKMLDRILRDALMNKFNWKDRKASVDYLMSLIYDKN